MSDTVEDKSDGLGRSSRADRRVRADAQRNIDTLLEAAKEVFIASGVDAPVREIAEKAMKIAGEICIYTNDRITIEELKG